MGEWFDELSRLMASGMSRRAALRRLGGGLALSVLATVGIRHSSAEAASENGTFQLPSSYVPLFFVNGFVNGDEADNGNVPDPDTGPKNENGCREGDPDCETLGENGEKEIICYDASGQPVFKAEWAGGGDTTVHCAPGTTAVVGSIPLFGMRRLGAASVEEPAPPQGLTEIFGSNVQLQPQSTPNWVNLVLHYTDEDVTDIDEWTLRMFYWDEQLAHWVELPSEVNPDANTVTVWNVDVSAFADALHRVSIFA